MTPALSIVLQLTDDGRVGLKTEGPAADNLVTLLGLLEFAKQTILSQQAQQQQAQVPAILPASFLPAGLNGRGRRGQ